MVRRVSRAIHHVKSMQAVPREWSFATGARYADPLDEVELDVVVGDRWRVPAFWSGDHTWRARFAPPEPGTYRWATVCSDERNEDLHGVEGELVVEPYDGEHPLLRHGALRASATRRYLEYADGTPFFWLGDTWTWCLRDALSFPDDWELLLADRVRKGFNVALVTPGLYGSMHWPDERTHNEGGPPWTDGFETLNPAYFDMADLRIQAMVRAGIVPCVVGNWGFYEGLMGERKLRQHWRHLVARWGAYPVVWCVAGEALLPFSSYDPEKPGEVFHELIRKQEGELARLRAFWSSLARYVRELDPHARPITVHPMSPGSSREQVDDPSVLDLVLLQTGHLDREALAPTVEGMVSAVAADPPLPVLNGEVVFEGILEMNRQEIQRLMFWASVLCGGCGHTYGALGVVVANTRERPYGPAAHGYSYSDTPWEDAHRFPGSEQLGFAKALLERYEWWRFEPHPEWVEPHWSTESYFRAYSAGIPGEVRFSYFPPTLLWRREGYRLAHLEPGVSYRAFWSDPATAREYPGGVVTGYEDGHGRPQAPPIFQDWVLVLERADGG
jgi:hypothetical protein